jgi:8-amino-7-oxononanoate synthase
MPALEEFACKELADITARSQLRTLQEVDSGLISFSSNDYLGLSQHPDVVQAALTATGKYGTGAGASRLVTGNHPLYRRLEEQLAAYRGSEAALVLGSGYLANSGIIPALVGKGDLILADRLSHACLLDGAKLSGATLLRFPHNNTEKCAALLATHRARYRHCLIVTDTVFSMDGDKAPLASLASLARYYECWLLTDDAHALEAGSLIADIHTGTLSKALGSYGGYVCASRRVIDYLANTTRSFIFSTGLPPGTVAAASAALGIVMNDPHYARRPIENARYFTTLLGLPAAESPIVPLIFGAEEKALAAAAYLKECGFLVSPIRPPTVPPGTARLRFTFSATHQTDQIELLAEAVQKLPGDVIAQ